ncbi:MAG: B12-binding domain-containing protein [Hyphomonas sp.]
MALEYDRKSVTGQTGGAEPADFGSLINSWAQSQGMPTVQAQRVFSAIQAEIIPRLVLARQSYHRTVPPLTLYPQPISDSDKEVFLNDVLNGSASDATDLARSLIVRGVPVEAVFIDLLAWSARRLGEYWNEDLCTFTDVTIALCRLHEVLHQISESTGASGKPTARTEHSILVSSVPGDQHVFGALMVAESFRRDGWVVRCEPGSSNEKLSSAVAKDGFDVVGLSCACDRDKYELADLIKTVRTNSYNRSAIVMVGGRLFIEHPELAIEVGADLLAQDGPSAVELARNRLANAKGDC